ncbi:hypothetical protein L6R52_10350 [Myxococcota bacterium]|nr:hypothetical protein [Myxococcota bacterium]
MSPRPRHTPAMIVGALVMLTVRPAELWAGGVAPLPMGPRTGAMGGTGVAQGDDSAMGFLNPAGLARSDRDTLSISLSAYALQATRIRAFFADPSADLLAGFDVQGNELRQQSFVAIPTALAYVFHVGDPETPQVLAFSLLTPRGVDVNLDGSMTADSFALRFDDRGHYSSSARTYDVGPSYAIELALGSDARLRLGASAFLAFSTLSQTLGLETLTGNIPPTEFAQISLYRHSTAWSFELAPIAGAQLDLGALSVGVAVHAPSLHLTGDVEGSARQSQLANGAFDQLPEVLVINREDGTYEERQPMRVLAGVALELGALTVAADAALTFGVGPYTVFDTTLETTTLTEGVAPVNESTRSMVEYSNDSVLDASVGVEYRASETFAIRAGGFTDLSNERLPAEPTARDAFLGRVHRFGATGGVAFGGGTGATTVAFMFIGGTGEAIGLDIGDSQNQGGGRRVDVLSTTLAVLISGTVDVQSLLGE